ncbi:MAG: UbiX family flavin prenyltransferase [Theionarchaea archaeon]|nr:UbiX family flavin prenyltransferase [Theionarchaea archaeon]MBU7036581.1 UbiX family flavin prenyltransferase [Theionarchaea archaeon]
MKTVVGITGASGTIYGIRLLQVLPGEKFVVVTENGKALITEETQYCLEDIKGMGTVYEDHELDAPFSSGSFLFDSLVVAPCSTSTLSKIACGISDTLITRCASVALKERRTLVLVPRETPLSTVLLQNMAKLSMQGASILPAMPAFYQKPQTVKDMVDFVVGKILDQLGVEHQLFQRWNPLKVP